MTLYIDLDSFPKTSDRKLLNRVPQKLARYYLAVPLAEEDGQVTVVTAHPENKAALWVLRRLLDADIMPVMSSETALKEAINRIYGAELPDTQTIVAWTDDPGQSANVREAAGAFSRLLDQPVTFIEGPLPIDRHGFVADGEECSLFIVGAENQATRFHLLRGLSTSLLLVRGEPEPIKKILVVLRGYASDHQTVSRALPFLAHEGAEATVLPLMRMTRWRMDHPLSGYGPARIHLETCLSGLLRANVDVSLRLRQGNPVTQIVAELAQSRYDLLVIAAEARCDFVLSVLKHIDVAGVLPTQPILIVKPPVSPALALA
jgi:nucleotide-binding universal stress UspA family protein